MPYAATTSPSSDWRDIIADFENDAMAVTKKQMHHLEFHHDEL